MIFIWFGAPQHIISDQGREFVNQINARLFTLTKTKHRIASAYHPQTNGLVERYNATLQRSLIKLVNENQTDWDTHLDGVLFAYRTSVHKSTGFSPFEIMFGRYIECMYCADLFLNFRKATLPIEAEMNGNGADDGGSHQSEDSEEREQICSQMKKLKEAIECKAMENIKKRLKIVTRRIMTKNIMQAKYVLCL